MYYEGPPTHAYINPDECNGCGACAPQCPTAAISINWDDKYVVDAEACEDTSCRAECVAACPLLAITIMF